MSELKYITRDQIDIASWDKCVLNSTHPLIYVRAIYLDAMCDMQWDAIVSKKYDFIFPLPWRKKFGIKYVYQPAFIQQLGIFSKKKISQKLVVKFVNLLKENVKFTEYPFNAGNNLSQLTNPIVLKKNYLLSLAPSYDSISSAYKSSFKTNLQRVKKCDLIYKKTEDINTVVRLYKELYGARFTSITNTDYKNFENLCIRLHKQKQVYIRQVYFEDELVAVTMLLMDEHRYYSIISCITEIGKKKRANYFLFDNMIKEFCNQNKFLDLEGSDIRGIEDFFKTMNPVLETYPFLKYNELPKIVKIFKK